MPGEGQGTLPSATGLSRRRWLSLGLAASISASLPKLASASPEPAVASAASTSEEDKQAAIRAIPFTRLKDDVQTRLRDIVLRPSIYRRLPDQAIDCHPDLFVFAVRYPEVVVNIWDLMSISNVAIRRTAPYNFEVTDGAGTVSKVELIYGTRHLHVVLAEGSYEGPLLKRKLAGRCVILLHSQFDKNASRRDVVKSRLDAFLSIDNTGAELVAKTLHPILGRTADHNFAESANFLSRLSQAATENSDGLIRFAERLQNVDGKLRGEFIRLVANIGGAQTARHDR